MSVKIEYGVKKKKIKCSVIVLSIFVWWYSYNNKIYRFCIYEILCREFLIL